MHFRHVSTERCYVIPTDEGLMMAHLALGWHAGATSERRCS
jgi:hypothetical protein